MNRYKKAPDSEWPGFPTLKPEDIQTESIRAYPYVARALVNNRKGRVVILMDSELYQQFLGQVRKRKGDISALHVQEAALEAIKEWIAKT